MVFHTAAEMTLLKGVLITFFLSGCLCQRDCTGVDCPLLKNCIEEVLDSGACCASCAQTGCTCEGYQYYDCVNAGFKNGKVPEGEAYFVDYGSTECSCPKGGGRISCHFISCPEIPANCIEVSEPADGCVECERIGCVHDGQKYEAGHSFHIDPCQVCHCPTDGGKLMCYPVPDCDPSNLQKPMVDSTTEENTHEKHHNDPYTFSQQHPVDHFSKPYRLSHSDKLPLFKPPPGHMDEGEEEDYDYDPTYTPDPSTEDLAAPTQSSISNRVISVSHPDWEHRASTYQGYDRAGKLELKESYGVHEDTTVGNRVQVTDRARAQVTDRIRVQVTDRDRERVTNRPMSVTEGPRGDTTTSTWPIGSESPIQQIKREEEESVVTLKNITGPEGKDVPYDIGVEKQERIPLSSHVEWNGRESDGYHERTMVEQSTKSPRKPEQHTLPTVRFSPSSQPPLRLKPDGGHRLKTQPQTLFNPNTEDTDRVEKEEVRDNSAVFLPKPGRGPGVSAKDLVQSCCEVGQRWAVEHNHCNYMPLLNNDKYSVCSVAQQQCCSGFLKENRCLAGMTAARGGDVCEVGAGDQCTEDSYQVCCSCCALGLRLRSDGQGCDAHNYLGYPCGHIFLTCCEAEDSPDKPSLRQKEMPRPTPLPKKVSDSKFPKEAFSMGEGDDADNSVEEQPDVDECQLYQGQLCHHTCVNTWGSYHCGCRLGFILQQDGLSCAPGVEEDNRVREDDGPSTVSSTTTASTTATPVLSNPCAGKGPCMQQCTVVMGEARCSCFPGFSLMRDRHMCEDVNECRTGTHNCSSEDLCVNKKGSFQCVMLNEMCDKGFIHMNKECVGKMVTLNCGIVLDHNLIFVLHHQQL